MGGTRARDIERKKARRCREVQQPDLLDLVKMCSCGASVFAAADSSGSQHNYELDATGRLTLEMSKRYVAISNRPVRTAWELYARAATAADDYRCKQHSHAAPNNTSPITTITSPHQTAALRGGSLKTDAQVKKLMTEMQKHGRIGLAAARSGMDRKTARKYVRAAKLPSELKQPRWWRTRKDPIAKDDWAFVETQLIESPGIKAKTLFEMLEARRAEPCGQGRLRTLQRRVRRWRARVDSADQLLECGLGTRTK